MNNKYTRFSKEELLSLVEKQEKELKSKKYGLVWDSEKEPEKVVLECENNIPILQRIKEKEIKTDDSEDNILIEGDNYHALTVLNYTHKEKIDVIYIDPPYNTGKANEWKYNDKYVDENDGYRHSKWLNFMEKRLRLAKNLLKETGVIFISIDDNEYSQLKLLCDKIFKETNFIGSAVRKRRDSQANLSNNISIIHEYVLIYGKSRNVKLNKISLTIDVKKYKNPDNDPRGEYVTMPCSNKGGAKYEIQTPTGVKYVDEWRFKKETYYKLVEENKIVFPRNGNGKPRYKLFLSEKLQKGVIPNSWWDNIASNQQGSSELKEIFKNKIVFNNPKPVDLIKFICKLNGNKRSIILDFFAGSGSTGHAVLELNKEDGGNRKFILCTNNENNICEEVTYPRIQKVIQGYEFDGKDKTLLLEKKIIFSNLYKNIKQRKNESDEDFKVRKEKELNKNISKIWQEVDKVIEDNKDKFDDFEKKFEDNIIKIYGIKNIDGFKQGLGGNLQYFKTDLIPVERIDKISDKKRIELTEKAGQMIAIKENTFEEVELNEWFQIFESKDNKRRTAIYFREDTDNFEILIDKIKDYNTTLYIFSYGRIDKKLYNYLGKNIRIEDIPEPILEIYKEINLTIKEK